MPTAIEELALEVQALRDELMRLTDRSPFTFAEVTDVNEGTNALDLQFADDVTLTLPGSLALSNYVPEIGHRVLVAMNGRDPVVIAPPGPPTSDAPAGVTGLTVEPGFGSVFASWDASTENDVKWNRGNYEVQYDVVSTFDDSPIILVAAATSAAITGLTVGTEYFVRVRAVDMSGVAGAWSAYASATPITAASSGVEIVTVLPTLPDAGYPPGTVVVLDDDYKLYRNDAGTWTAAVDTTDLVGTITGAQIAAGTITAANILGDTITAAQIAAGAIGVSELAADSVTATAIAASAVVAGKIAANAVTTGTLAADAVTAAKISAIALEAGKYVRSTSYVAGTSGWSIEADGTAEFADVTLRGAMLGAGVNLLTNGGAETDGDGVNVVVNGHFDTDLTGWAAYANCTVARVTTPTQAGAGALSMTSSAAGTMHAASPTGAGGFPVVAGSLYQVKGYARAASVAGRPYGLRVSFFDSGGTLITNVEPGEQCASITGTTSYQLMTGYAFAPQRAAYARVYTYVGSVAAAGEVHYFDTITLAQFLPGWRNSATAQSISHPYTGLIPSRDTSVKQTGAASYKLAFTAYQDIGYVGTAAVAAKPNRAYKVTWSWRATTTRRGFRMRADFWSATGTFLGSKISHENSDGAYPMRAGAWDTYSWTTKTPANTAYIGFGFDFDFTGAPVTETMNFDDWSITAVPLFDGGYTYADRLVSRTDVYDFTGLLVPVGTFLPWGGQISASDEVWALGGEGEGGEAIAGVPAGFIPCDGRNVSRTTWWRLFSVFGTRFGAGDGSTTFAVPDFRTRAPLGGTLITDAPAVGNLAYAIDHTHLGGAHYHAYWKSNPTLWTNTSNGQAYTGNMVGGSANVVIPVVRVPWLVKG